MSVPRLWTPQGGRALNRELVELAWSQMTRFMEFAELATALGIGVHCAKCDQDLVGSNGDHDPVLKMACGCREFWSANARLPRA